MKPFNLKTAILLFSALFSLKAEAQSYGEIRGIIKNSSLEAVPYATIKILQGNMLVGGTQSNEEGRYSYKPLNPGSYEMVVMQPEYLTQPVNKIKIVSN